jgi:hypothetical protein
MKTPFFIRYKNLLFSHSLIVTFTACACFCPSVIAATINSTASGGAWNWGTSWVGGSVPQSGDNAVVVSGATITIDVSTSRNSGTMVTINSGGILVFDDNCTMTGAGGFTLSSGATLKIGSPGGISASASSGNIQVTGTRSFSTGANYEYNPSLAWTNQITGDGLPATVNNLTINNSGYTVTLTANVSASGNLSIIAGTLILGSNTANRSSAGGTLTIASGAGLKIGGANSFPSNYSTQSVNANSTVEYYGNTQSVAVLNSSQNYGNLIISGTGTKTLTGTESVAGNLTISGGTFDLGSYTINRGSAGGTLSIAAGAGLKIGVTNGFPTNYATITLNATSTVEFAGTNQTILAQNYGHLTLSNSGTKTFAAGVTGIAGALTLGGSVSANLIANGTTIDYNKAGAQTIPAINYYNLTFSNSGTKILANGTTGIAGALTFGGSALADLTSNSTTVDYNKNGVQTVPALNYFNLTLDSSGVKTFVAGTTGIAGVLSVGGSASADAMANSTTLDYCGSGVQTISSLTYYNLSVSQAGVTSLVSSVTVNNNLTISGGTLDLGGYAANRSAAGGTLTIANGATLKIGGTNTIPSNFTTHSIGGTSTIEFYGSGQSVAVPNSSQTYGNLTISGSGMKTLMGEILISGNFLCSAGILNLNGYNFGVTGNLTINNGSFATFPGGNLNNRKLTVGGNASFNGTAGDSLEFTTTAGMCTLAVTGTLRADYAKIGNNRAYVSAGTPTNCRNLGGNFNWSFAEEAPYGLAYLRNVDTASVGIALMANPPTVLGAVTSYGVSPALPAGLMINTATGVISGTPTTESAPAIYTITAQNAWGSTTAQIRMTVKRLPAIATQPVSQTITAGGTAVFFIKASGSAPLSYQWTKGATNIPSGTTDTLVLTGLPAGDDNTIYRCRVKNVYNDSQWSASCTLRVNSPLTGEDYSQWSYYKNIVVNTKSSGAGVMTAQFKFPLLVRLNAVNAGDVFSGSAKSANNGQDIRFAKINGTHLPCQRERYDSTNRVAEFWVLMDTVKGNDSSAALRMYWGKSNAADSSNGPAVFNAANGGFAGVWHFTNNGFNNSASGDYNADNGGTIDTVGVIGGARKFVANHPDSIRVTGLLGTPNNITMACWTKIDSIDGAGVPNQADTFTTLIGLGNNVSINAYRNANGTRDSIVLFVGGSIINWVVIFQPGTANLLKQGWKYITCTLDSISHTISLYVNGIQVVSKSVYNYGPLDWSRGNNTFFGHFGNGGIHENLHDLGGCIDEARIDKVARNADWIKLCYKNQLLTGASDSLTALGGTVNVSIAPYGLTYLRSADTASIGVAMTANTPIVSGVVTAYGISPALPPGLTLNTTTGAICGTPTTESAPATYTITAQNASGSTTAQVRMLVKRLPAIVTQPVSRTVTVGGSDMFFIKALGSAPLLYQWMKSGIIIRSATDDTLILTGVPAADHNSIYRCRVMNDYGDSIWSASCTLKVNIPPSGEVLWFEDFNNLYNGTYFHTGEAAWNIDGSKADLDNGHFNVQNHQFEGNNLNGEAVWKSEFIDIAFYQNIAISMDVSSTGSLETVDYLNAYYTINNGAETALQNGVNNGYFSAKTATASGLSGNKVRIIVRVKNSAVNEKYFFDNIRVTGVVKPLPDNIVWNETFNDLLDGAITDNGASAWTRDISNAPIGSNGYFDVSFHRLLGRNLAGEAVWKSQPIDISAYPAVDISMDLYALGLMESNEDYIKAFYRLNGGSEIPLTNGVVNGAVECPVTAYKNTLTGATLELVVREKNTSANERHALDNIIVKRNDGVPTLVIDASGGTISCATPSVTLGVTANISGAIYAWSGPNGFASTLQNPLATQLGSYIVTVACGSQSKSDTSIVTQNSDKPTVSISVIGSSLIASSATPGAVSTWTGFPEGINPVTITDPGVYTVTVRNPVNGCVGTDSVSVNIPGKVLWLEDFTAANGTTADNGPTSWSIQNTGSGMFSVQNNEFKVSGIGTSGEGKWNSASVPIAGMANVKATINIRSSSTGGGLNGSGPYMDYLRIYYKLNDGAETLIADRCGDINGGSTQPTTVSAAIPEGSTVQIIIHARASGTDEFYYFDNVKIACDSQNIVTLWQEDFNNLNNGAAYSMDAAAWNIDGSKADLNNGHFNVQNHQFEGNNLNGEAVWKSEFIDISNYQNVAIGMGVSCSGSLEIPDYMNIYYTIDTGMETALEDGVNNGYFSAKTATASGLSGNKLRIIVRVNNSASDKKYFFDNIIVTGFPKMAPGYLVWNETFNDLPDGAVADNGASAWTRDISNAPIGSNGYFDVRFHRLLGRNLGGEAVWKSRQIDISTYPAVDISMDLYAFGLMESNQDYIKAFYRLNGGSEVPLTDGVIYGVAENPVTAYKSALTGATLELVVREKNTSINERHALDNIAIKYNDGMPALEIDASGGTISCASPSVRLGVTANVSGLTYVWSGPNGFASTIQNPLVTEPGYYVVTAVKGVQSKSDTVVVAENKAAPEVTAMNAELSCVNSMTLLQVNSSITDASFLWNGPGGFTSHERMPVVSEPGYYVVRITDTSNACYSLDTAVVRQCPNAPGAQATVSGSLSCNTAIVTLFGGSTKSGVSYSWKGPNGFSSIEKNPQVGESGIYTLMVTDSASGCASSANITVMNDTARIDVAAGANGSLTCANNAVTLWGNSSYPGVLYNWTGSDGFATHVQNPSVSAPGTYTLTVTNPSNGCVSAATVTVTESKSAPGASATASGSLTCASALVTLYGHSSASGVSYSWSGPGNFSSIEQNPQVCTGGTYTLTVTNAANGCSSEASVSVDQISSAPLAIAHASGPLSCESPSVTLLGGSPTSGVTFSWSGPKGFSSQKQNPATSDAGAYTLTVTNPANGCSSIATTIVEYVP